MPRRRRAEKREILPDPKHKDVLVSKFINILMVDGKKSVAEKIVYGAFDEMTRRSGQDALQLFHKAIENIRPELEVRSRRVGGATYQVPMEVRPERARALAFRWLAAATRNRNEPSMTERLARELMDAVENRGNTVKKRDDTHKMAEANRAFSHYRW